MLPASIELIVQFIRLHFNAFEFALFFSFSSFTVLVIFNFFSLIRLLFSAYLNDESHYFKTL